MLRKIGGEAKTEGGQPLRKDDAGARSTMKIEEAIVMSGAGRVSLRQTVD